MALNSRPQKVSPGEWIKVAVPSAWPLLMKVGPLPEKRVFLDRDGGQVYAQTRCPELAPGPYTVRVRAGGTVIEASIVVV